MADPRDDDLEAEMMDIINAGTEHCADVDNDQQEDDGSQYLNLDHIVEEVVHEDNSGEVYISQYLALIYLLCIHVAHWIDLRFIILFVFLCVHSRLDRRQRRGTQRMFEGPKSRWKAATSSQNSTWLQANH